MGIPAGTILSRAKREGWTQQIQSGKALTSAWMPPLRSIWFKPWPMSIRHRGERHIGRMARVSERGIDHIETMDGPEILNAVHGSRKARQSCPAHVWPF